MPRDGAEVRARARRCATISPIWSITCSQLGVGREVVRPDPDPGAGPEVAQDLPLGELPVHGREVVDVDGDGAAAALRLARARDPEAGRRRRARSGASVCRSELALIRSTPISSIRS